MSLKVESKKALKVSELSTPWSSIKPDDVLKEYPRPQFVRESYINLNGYWDYAITDSAVTCFPTSSDGKILVPFSPEAPLSGVNRQLLPNQILWYKTCFKLNEAGDGKRTLLHFGAVDQKCTVYINKQVAGSHEGGYTPFYLDITPFLNAEDDSENELVVQCTDVSDTSYHPRGKQRLTRGGMFYTAQSGIWQTVWLERVNETYIEKIKITPDVDKHSVRMDFSLRGGNDVDSVLRVTLRTSEQTFETKENSLNIVLDDPQLWSPENPYLYYFKIELSDSAGNIFDTVTSYFAMRKVSVEKDENGIARIFLNGKPYFQGGILDQGYWPDGLYTAPCDEALVFDVEAVKEAGFNMIRKHCKTEPLRWYYHCDRLGMLVWQDIINGGEEYNLNKITVMPNIFTSYGAGANDKPKDTGRLNEDGKKEWYETCKEIMETLYNCPCIVAWTVFNEGWGQFDTEETTRYAMSLDDTRLFDQASGWFDHSGGDFVSIHNYFRKLKCPKTNTISNDPSRANACRLRASVISEYGGLTIPFEDHIATEKTFGYKNIKTKEEYMAKLSDIREKIRSLIPKGLSAAVYTQVSDIEDELNGIVTYDRKIKKYKP